MEARGRSTAASLYQLNSFSFDDQQTLNIGSQSSGAGAGKVTFNPLDLVLTQPALTPALFEMLATGAAFKEVDVLGYGQDGTLATDDSFGLVAASDLSSGSSGTTTVALQYGSASFTSTPPGNGTPTSASWDRITNTNDFSTDGETDPPPLAAPATLNDAQTLSPAVSPGLTYYVRFTTANGSTGPLDGSTLYQLNSFSFDDQQTLNIGSQSSGAGAGKVTFNPLDLVLTQPAMTPALFEMLATGAAFKEVDVLGYGQDGTLATDDKLVSSPPATFRAVAAAARRRWRCNTDRHRSSARRPAMERRSRVRGTGSPTRTIFPPTGRAIRLRSRRRRRFE